MRPAALTDGPRTARYRAGTDLRLSFRSRFAFADVAHFMLAQLGTDEYLHRAVAIGPA